ncbi:hypothetical protein D0B54_01915 [Solimonas sp. K1W22B-7]|uniref:cupin domain-containing protein n=1 Tax=Solimonas sp. K1W22B-7 TaxID=2303331 RepID=UPI000E33078C|nr:cupin domain-containing protein [Solimonas sp. K1W22B-7]AXQ27511.1 hypothetical protein D0B54_01915 [Solimonas sp. K1W22B-7]
MQSITKAFAVVVLVLMCGVIAAEGGPIRDRFTPDEIDSKVQAVPGVGSSGVAGIRTVVLHGNPSQPGLYTIQLRVPAGTTIQAHHHPDGRTVTVVSGVWRFGYGQRFDSSALKVLTAGSFYTEPRDDPHFAQTGSEPAVVNITGIGPTGTHYEDPKNDPSIKK